MDFCLESSQMSYMPLKGLRLLRPFRDELWLVTVIPDDFQSASKELFAFSCSIFLSPLFLTPCLTFSLVPSLFSSSLSSPLHSCAVTDLLMHARSGGSHAVLTIWDGQLLQSRGVSRSTLSAGTQPPHRLPDSRFSPRVLPFCWPQTPSPTQGLPSWGEFLRFPDHRAQTLQLGSPIPMDLFLHPLPMLHVEPERKQEKYENVEAFNSSAPHFEPFSFCYWNTLQIKEVTTQNRL